MIAATACRAAETQPFDRFPIEIPLHGNSYVTAGDGVRVDRPDGITNWVSSEAVVSLFFGVPSTGMLDLAIKGSAPLGAKLSVEVGGKKFDVKVKTGGENIIVIGRVQVEHKGYMRVDIRGVERKGADFGNYSALMVGGSATQGGKMVYAPAVPAEAAWQYWGRRGPSVHCRYDLGGRDDVRWFYNELTVPHGNDPAGIYAMANGFAGGYFGLQVAADGGRRVLFSVWSTFKTDDPKLIPAEFTVKGVRRGDGVTVQDFGNEGSGAQSFMAYDWQAGQTYAFLTSAEYDAETNATTFTGYFRGHDGQWRLVAALRQPHPSARSIVGAYSFLENFLTAQGWIDRRVNFNNQWMRTADGEWREVTRAAFSYDNTARNAIRLDYAGWADGDGFWLRNCGFFNDNTTYDTPLIRSGGGAVPQIDLEALLLLGK